MSNHLSDASDRVVSYVIGGGGISLGSWLTMGNIESAVTLAAALGGAVLVWMRVYADWRKLRRNKEGK